MTNSTRQRLSRLSSRLVRCIWVVSVNGLTVARLATPPHCTIVWAVFGQEIEDWR
jgi:hypothetical protein